MKPHEFALPVPASPPAVTDARHRAVKALGHWGGELDAEVLQTAELVLSELLTNAVQHAGTGHISLMLRRLPDAVRIEVDDANSSLPKLDLPDAYNEHGRGMLLVSVLADRYGTERTCEGKRCWAEINLPTPSNRQLSPGPSDRPRAGRPLPQRQRGRQVAGMYDCSTSNDSAEAPPSRASTAATSTDIQPGDH